MILSLHRVVDKHTVENKGAKYSKGRTDYLELFVCRGKIKSTLFLSWLKGDW